MNAVSATRRARFSRRVLRSRSSASARWKTSSAGAMCLGIVALRLAQRRRDQREALALRPASQDADAGRVPFRLRSLARQPGGLADPDRRDVSSRGYADALSHLLE